MTLHRTDHADRPRSRRWRGPAIGVAALALAAAGALVAMPDASAATFNMQGWATQGGGTSGGGSASPVTVTTSSALISNMQASGARVIRVSGSIAISGMQKVAANKTIIGVGSGAAITGGGLNVASVSNVIIRNINFRNWGDDAINVQYSTRVWIDHNNFSSGSDGAVDIKRGSDYVTVSWNRVFSHDKSMLLGHSDDNGGEDRGHLRVTYNGNYFENVEAPFHRGEGSSPGGSLVARNNHFVNSGSGDQGGSVRSIPYSYQMDSASSVKASVTSGAGTGKI
jgi:pectate lyase